MKTTMNKMQLSDEDLLKLLRDNEYVECSKILLTIEALIKTRKTLDKRIQETNSNWSSAISSLF